MNRFNSEPYKGKCQIIRDHIHCFNCNIGKTVSKHLNSVLNCFILCHIFILSENLYIHGKRVVTKILPWHVVEDAGEGKEGGNDIAEDNQR